MGPSPEDTVELIQWAPYGREGGRTASPSGACLSHGFSADFRHSTPAPELSTAPSIVSNAGRVVSTAPPGPDPLWPRPAVSPGPGRPISPHQPADGAPRTVSIADHGTPSARSGSGKGTLGSKEVSLGTPNLPDAVQPSGAPRTVSIADYEVPVAWAGSRNGTDRVSDGTRRRQVDMSGFLRQTRSGRLFAIWEVAFELDAAGDAPAGDLQGSGLSARLNQSEIDHSWDPSGQPEALCLLDTAGKANPPPHPGPLLEPCLAAGSSWLGPDNGTNKPAAHLLTTEQPGGPDTAPTAAHCLSLLVCSTARRNLHGVDRGLEESGGNKRKGGQPSMVKRRRHRENYAAKRKDKKLTQAKDKVWRKNHLNRGQFATTPCDARGLAHTKPGFIGMRDSRPGRDGIPYHPAPGYRYIEARPGQHDVLVDKQGVLFAFRIAAPDFFGEVIAGVTRAIERFSRNYDFSLAKYKEPNRRGDFKSAVMGISFGGGQTGPSEFSDSDHNLGVIEAFRGDPDVRKMVRHAMNAWSTWNPGLMGMYTKAQTELYALKPDFAPLFRDCPYLAATVNLGPRTVCRMHRDSQNLSYGQCCIMPFGDFNHTRGGQLYLEEPNVFFELCPGDTLFIPSAAVTHGNIPIADGEKRYSFTLYSAGALFQWIALNGRVKNTLHRTAREQVDLAGELRWQGGWRLYRNLAQL